MGPLEQVLRAGAARIGCSPGQAYTAGVGLLVSGSLFLAVLPGLGRGPAGVVQATTATSFPAAAEESTTTSTIPPFVAEAPSPAGPADVVPTSAPVRDAADGPPTAAPVGSGCGAAAVLEASDKVLTPLDSLAPVLRLRNLRAAIAAAAGCSDDDPLVAFAAFLVQVGAGLPDPGLPEIDLPPLPLVTLPESLDPVLAPVAPAARPACAAVGQAVLLALLVADSYPVRVSPTDLAAVAGQALVVCGTLAAG